MPWYDDVNNPDKDPQANFEEHIVRRILQRGGATSETSRLIEANGNDLLTFYSLCELLHFPIWLVARRVPGLPTLEDDMLRRPTKTALFHEFASALDEIPDELGCGHVGVVFPWAHVDRYNVFHNRMPTTLGKCGRWYRLGPQKHIHLLEPLDSLLDSLGPAVTW